MWRKSISVEFHPEDLENGRDEGWDFQDRKGLECFVPTRPLDVLNYPRQSSATLGIDGSQCDIQKFEQNRES